MLKTQTSLAFGVTSHHFTGSQWIRRLESLGRKISPSAKELFRPGGFPTTDGVEYELAVIMADEFDFDPTEDEIQEEARERGYSVPPAEVVPLLAETISRETLVRMGVRVLEIMHHPIPDGDYEPARFQIAQNRAGLHIVVSWITGSRRPRYPGLGFVFLESKI